MNREVKLILALQQISNVYNLLNDGPYAAFMASHLLPIKYECERQLVNLRSEKCKEIKS